MPLELVASDRSTARRRSRSRLVAGLHTTSTLQCCTRLSRWIRRSVSALAAKRSLEDPHRPIAISTQKSPRECECPDASMPHSGNKHVISLLHNGSSNLAGCGGFGGAEPNHVATPERPGPMARPPTSNWPARHRAAIKLWKSCRPEAEEHTSRGGSSGRRRSPRCRLLGMGRRR